jgi:predicted ABC-type ATPase
VPTGRATITDKAAVGELVVVTGPPGAGKSSVSEHLADRRTPSALVAGDTFFAMIKQGFILPWLPESHNQTAAVSEAAAAAAGRLTGICFVVYDGVVGPWLLPAFVRAARASDLHYVVLLPSLDVCLERVRTRVDHGFSDLSVTRALHRQFVDARVDTRHLITEPKEYPTDLAELIALELGSGRYRYPPS